MGKKWLRALAIAVLGLGTRELRAQNPDPPTLPLNGFSETVSPGGQSDFAPDPTAIRTEFVPRWEIDTEAAWFLFRRNSFSFPLATTGSVLDKVPGALGQKGTRIIADESTFNDRFHIGMRTTATYWMFEPEVLGIQASYFLTEQATNAFGASNLGNFSNPVLARPFFNPVLAREDSDPRAIPSVMSGNIDLAFTTRLTGADLSVLYNVSSYSRFGPSLFLLGGPRWVRLDERFSSNEYAIDLPPRPAQTFLIQDSISTQNDFYGVQLGTLFRYRIEGVAFDLVTKVSAGYNREQLTIAGNTTITDQNNLVANAPQGLFAQPSNIGRYENDGFCLIPEVSLKAKMNLTENVRLSVGYGFMYMTQVARPGSHLDRNINIQPLNAPTQVGPALPGRPSITESNFWTHAINFGLEFVF